MVKLEIKDLIGTTYTRLTIIGEDERVVDINDKLHRVMICKCSCGNTISKRLKDLRKGEAKSCGCLAKEIKTKIIKGGIYNLWTVIKETEGYFDKKGEKKDRTFLCKCICGKEKDVNLQSLKKGESKSCGCQGIIREEKIIKDKIIPQDTEEEQWKESVSYPGYYISTLGRFYNYSIQYMFPVKTSYGVSINSKTKEFLAIKEMYKTFIDNYNEDTHVVVLKSTEIKLENIELNQKLTKEEKEIKCKLRGVYSSMKTRCNNPNCKDYKIYGARGIKIEESFSCFSKFYAWAIESGYKVNEDLSIDRINNDGNYADYNCQWISKRENNRKTRRNIITELLAQEIRYGKYKDFSDKDIAELIGCHIQTIKLVRQFKTWI